MEGGYFWNHSVDWFILFENKTIRIIIKLSQVIKSINKIPINEIVFLNEGHHRSLWVQPSVLSELFWKKTLLEHGRRMIAQKSGDKCWTLSCMHTHTLARAHIYRYSQHFKLDKEGNRFIYLFTLSIFRIRIYFHHWMFHPFRSTLTFLICSSAYRSNFSTV